MELQSYRLYIIDRACGHTEAYKTPTALTRRQIYQMEAETCSKCQKTQNAAKDNTAILSPATPAQPQERGKLTKNACQRYEEAFNALLPQYRAGKVPIEVFADALGVKRRAVYCWLRKYADVTALRIVNGGVFRGGE